MRKKYRHKKRLTVAILQLFGVFGAVVCVAQARPPATPQPGDVTAKEMITALEGGLRDCKGSDRY